MNISIHIAPQHILILLGLLLSGVVLVLLLRPRYQNIELIQPPRDDPFKDNNKTSWRKLPWFVVLALVLCGFLLIFWATASGLFSDLPKNATLREVITLIWRVLITSLEFTTLSIVCLLPFALFAIGIYLRLKIMGDYFQDKNHAARGISKRERYW